MNPAFWTLLDELVARSEVVIDRPKGSAHPRFPENISPYVYGYLSCTNSSDGQGKGVWLGCTPAEQRSIADFLNPSPSFQCLLVPRL